MSAVKAATARMMPVVPAGIGPANIQMRATGAIASPETPGVSDDVRQALLALGYNERETTEAVRQLPPDLPVGEAIRQALRALSKT